MRKIPEKDRKNNNKKKVNYKTLLTVLKETYVSNEIKEKSVKAYDIDFKQVRTADLIRMYRNLTLFDQWTGSIIVKAPDAEREEYFKTLASFINVKFSEVDAESIRNKTFLEQKDKIIQQLRNILATREHIPNAKEIRRKKAQGKYVID